MQELSKRTTPGDIDPATQSCPGTPSRPGAFSRRDFLQLGLNSAALAAMSALPISAVSAAAGASLSGAATGSPLSGGAALPAHLPAGIRAIAFDAFPIFNPRPVFELAAKLAGDKGAEFTETWRTRQFEYTWLRTSGGRYKDFWELTRDALDFAAAKCGLSLGMADKEQLMRGYLSLPSWPDVVPALKALRERGIRLVFLSNMTRTMLRSSMQHAQLEEYFEEVLSTEMAHSYKPDPLAYRLGPDKLRLKKEEILFVAHAGWDAAGAKWFGYPVFWVNRQQLPAEVLDAVPDGTGKDLTELVEFVKSRG